MLKPLQEEHHSQAIEKFEVNERKSADFSEIPENSAGISGRRGSSYTVLKRCVLIFNDLIFESRVDRGMPSLAAAPVGPDTRPLVSAKAASILSFSRAEISSESDLFNG
jgi:hypothetical protein